MIYFEVKILKNLDFHFSQHICIIFGTDEENSWQGVAYYFKKETMPDFDIFPDSILYMI